MRSEVTSAEMRPATGPGLPRNLRFYRRGERALLVRLPVWREHATVPEPRRRDGLRGKGGSMNRLGPVIRWRLLFATLIVALVTVVSTVLLIPSSEASTG